LDVLARGRRARFSEGRNGAFGVASWASSATVVAMPSTVSRQDAWNLLTDWVSSPSLRRHMLAVEAAMRAYAPRFDGDVELWGATGLLHDLDYERYPSLEDGHPRYALRELEAQGYPPELVRAVASHADFMGVPRESPMEKTLYAVDELSGFVLAVAYVRPQGLEGMTPKSVKKKLKQPSFAAAVHREELYRGAEELGVDFDEHLTVVIGALAEREDELMGTDEARGAAAPDRSG
jgi:putative nucleotidyltransferase with HDIG domain